MEKYFKPKKYAVTKKETGFARLILMLILIPIICLLMHGVIYIYLGEFWQWIWFDIVLGGTMIYAPINYFKMLEIRKHLNERMPEYIIEIHENSDIITFYGDFNNSREARISDIKDMIFVLGEKGNPYRYRYEFNTDRYNKLFVEFKDGKVWLFKPLIGTPEEFEKLRNRCNL